MASIVTNLVQVSQLYGRNPEYVIAGGGNTSCKDDEHLWIKASGTSLATISEDGFAKMNRNCLKKISEKTYSSDALKREAEIKEDLYDCIAGDKSKRPSVETSLHNLLEKTYVVHTHPTLINALMCSKDSREETRSLFGDNALFIEYTDPGYILFKLVEKNIKEYQQSFGKEPEIIFLENHGVFVASDTIDGINKIYESINDTLNSKIKSPLPPFESEEAALEEYLKKLTNPTNLTAKAYKSALIDFFVKDENAFSKVSTAFTPDNIVYCKAHYLYSDSDPSMIYSEFKNFEKKFGYPPRVIAIKNKGIICIEENEKSVNTVFEVYLDMLKIAFLSESFSGPKSMTDKQIEFIDNWEVENYRRTIAKSTN